MSRFFTPDNPVMEFIAKIFDLVILNLIFIFSCVPIITIGASTSALSYVTLKMVRGEDPYIWRNFWKSFRQNFKQGTLVWIFSILIFIFLGMDFYIINSQNTSLFAVVRILLWIVCAVALSVFLYVFPVISHFVCTTKQALKNALLMTFGHLPVYTYDVGSCRTSFVPVFQFKQAVCYDCSIKWDLRILCSVICL